MVIASEKDASKHVFDEIFFQVEFPVFKTFLAWGYFIIIKHVNITNVNDPSSRCQNLCADPL